MDAVASRLDYLAGEPAYQNFGSDLKRLAGDLRAGDTAAWRQVDLVTYFDADSVVGQAHGWFARLSRHVEIVRNVLLFTPLFFTWVGIFAAVRAYRDLLAAPWEEQRQFQDASFLQLWTRGFGDRTWWTLDNVALCDFAALAAVILTFLVGSWMQNRTARAEEQDRWRRVSDLRSGLVDAALLVRRESGELVDRMSASIRSLLPEYQRTVQQLVTAQRELTSLVTDGKDNIALMVRATGELAISSSTIAESAKCLERPTGELAGHVHGMEMTARGLAANLGHVATGITSAKDGMTDIVKGASDLNRELRDLYANRVEELRQESSAHAATVGELVEARQEMNRSIESGRAGVERWAAGAKSLVTSGTSVVDSANELRDNVTALRVASEKFDATVGTMVSGTESLANHLPAAQKGVLDVLKAVMELAKKLDGFHDRMDRNTANLAFLADNPQATANAAKRTAETARDVQLALQKTVEALPEQMDQLRVAVVAAFDREMAHRRTAAESLGTSVDKFNGTAGETAQALREAVDGLSVHTHPDAARAAHRVAGPRAGAGAVSRARRGTGRCQPEEVPQGPLPARQVIRDGLDEGPRLAGHRTGRLDLRGHPAGARGDLPGHPDRWRGAETPARQQPRADHHHDDETSDTWCGQRVRLLPAADQPRTAHRIASPQRDAHLAEIEQLMKDQLARTGLKDRRAGVVLSFGVADEPTAGADRAKAFNAEILPRLGPFANATTAEESPTAPSGAATPRRASPTARSP